MFGKFTGKHPCWSSIQAHLQNSTVSVFQQIFRKNFYRTTANCYFGSKKGRCKCIGHQQFCLSQELLEKRQSSDFFDFCQKFLSGIIFRGLCLKNIFDQEQTTKIQLLLEKEERKFFEETKKCSAKMCTSILK